MSTFNLSAKLDNQQVKKILNNVNAIENGAELALFRSLKATKTKAVTSIDRAIRSDVRLKSTYVKGKLKTTNPSFSRLSFSIRASRRGLLMSKYTHKRLKRGGVSVRIKKGRGVKKLKGAFIIKRLKNSGVEGIAIRKDGKLKVLYAPSVSQVFGVFLARSDKIQTELADFFVNKLDREVANILKRSR